MATGSKLDGNTLHIRASFLECTTILWLKWLTLHRIYSTIIHSECWLSKLPRKSPFLNSTREMWLGNLVERLAHCIISQAFGRWALVSAFTVVVLIIRERLTRGSLWLGSITTILFIARKIVRIGGSLPSLFMAQLPLQMINLQLHGFSILLMRKVAPALRLTPASIGGMHTNLSVPFSLKINKMILTLGLHRFLSIWTWTYHSWTLNAL